MLYFLGGDYINNANLVRFENCICGTSVSLSLNISHQLVCLCELANWNYTILLKKFLNHYHVICSNHYGY